jgi:hypothetical protein
MTGLHFEDALNFLIDELTKIPAAGPGQARSRERRAHGSDIWIDDVSTKYWESHGKSLKDLNQDDKEPFSAPFHDAAWELARRGILRPAAAVPDGQSAANHMGQRVNASPFFGDGYSLTAWGREWVNNAAAERLLMPSDPGRITEVLNQFKSRFGAGYAQRATEAVADWRAGNYLSACTMAGAAAESILIATAIGKIRDEAKVLVEYRGASGRGRIIKRMTGNAASGIGAQFQDALGILSYWRDDAAHGLASTIGEIDAYEAISRLLRLARFVSDNWAALT